MFRIRLLKKSIVQKSEYLSLKVFLKKKNKFKPKVFIAPEKTDQQTAKPHLKGDTKPNQREDTKPNQRGDTKPNLKGNNKPTHTNSKPTKKAARKQEQPPPKPVQPAKGQKTGKRVSFEGDPRVQLEPLKTAQICILDENEEFELTFEVRNRDKINI